jgi:hypothetical protein
VTAAPDHVLKVSIAICVGTFLVWLLLSPGLVIAGTLLLRLLLDVEGAYASLRLLRPVTLSELLQDRQGHAPLVGRAVPAAVSTAPLSGTPCVGFRLVGVVDGVQLDDAWIGSFAIEHDDSTPARAVPGAARLVLPVVEPASIALDAEQSTRLCQLLSERGLPTQLQQVWLAEAVLAPNAEVRVWGAQSEEAADASAGYRQRAVRTLVSGTDAVPMLIAPS